jgi:hypothetical protein
MCLIYTHVDDLAGTGPAGEMRSDFKRILEIAGGRELGEIDGKSSSPCFTAATVSGAPLPYRNLS